MGPLVDLKWAILLVMLSTHVPVEAWCHGSRATAWWLL